MTTDSQTELYLPVRAGFTSDNDLHRRQNRAIEQWAKSPFVTNARIKDATIESAKIHSLEVDKLTSGTLTADVTVTGLMSAPATTGWRVEIGDPALPIRYWDGATTRFSVDTSGNVDMTGEIVATGGSITGTLNVTGLIRSPATGYRIEIGDATYPLRYWDGVTPRLTVDVSGNVAMIGNITATGGSITGTLDVTGLIRVPGTGFRVELGNASYPLRFWDGSGANTYFTMSNSGAVVARDIEVRQSGTSATGLRVVAASNSDADDPAIELQNSSGDTIWTVTNDGRMFFGSVGLGWPVATFNTLKASTSNEAIVASGQVRATEGVVTKVAAGGTCGDVDFAVTPQNGTLGLTSSGGTHKLWARLGGTWRQVTLT